ncbi:hypothetical protein L7F22_029330 [Adiantum nelumboides]|nr:hypothetical protein [Adiantum nelumboides]
MGATHQVVAVKASHAVARWFSVSSTDTSESRKSTKSHRASFVESLPMGAPPHFRLIDCQETLKRGSIFLVDWQQGIPYTAISHTWGLPVYAALDCPCATDQNSSITKVRCNPKLCCPQTAEHQRIIQGMLCMCKRLHYVADVNYIWHDGVCIAQYDEKELYEAMKHMAWVYGNAKETVIFFHYVGKPLVPVAPLEDVEYSLFAYEKIQAIMRRLSSLVHRIFPSRSDAVKQLLPRWFSRAWTYQEAVVSPKRRYCIRLGDVDRLASCWTWADYEMRLKEWDEDETAVKVLEEEEFVNVLHKLSGKTLRLMTYAAIARSSAFHIYMALMVMVKAIESRVWPQDPITLLFEASSRECNHKEDRLNSMLGLAGVRDFVVKREGLETLEASTIEFLSRMGHKGLARAMCGVNSVPKTQPWTSSWVPDLDRPIRVAPLWDDEGGWISSVEVVQEGGGAAVLKMKVSRAACIPIHLSTSNTAATVVGCLILHSRVIPPHTGSLWRKRLDIPEWGLMEELGTCIMECEQHNRLYEDDNMQLFLVCLPERLLGGHCDALLLSQHGASGRWFKAGFLSSVSTFLVEFLRTTPLADHHFTIC